MSAIDQGWPDAGEGMCCIGAAVYGPGHCTCWTPVYDLDQAEPDTTITHSVMPRRCSDCAFLRNSPERADEYASEQLDRIPAGARRLAALCYEHARLHPAPRTDDGSNQ